MKTPDEDGKPADNMDLLKQQAAGCGPECCCNTPATRNKTRWMIGLVVLAAAGTLVVRAMVKTKSPSPQSAAPTFAAVAASPVPTEQSGNATNSAITNPAAETSVGTSIGALAELNVVAAQTDAVLIFLPGKEGVAGNPPVAIMKGAASLIESKAAIKCGLFTLKAGTRDYEQIAAQMSVPGVLAMVKGRGMSAVSGEITETKLVQGFVAASSAGGCGSGGGGCGPSAAGCK